MYQPSLPLYTSSDKVFTTLSEVALQVMGMERSENQITPLPGLHPTLMGPRLR